MNYKVGCWGLLLCVALSLSAVSVFAQRRSKTRAQTPAPKRSLSERERALAQNALSKLRILRDGWRDVDPELVWRNAVMGGKTDREYELHLLEAKDAVNEALMGLPDGALKEAIRSAMDVFLDLEEIYRIFNKGLASITTVTKVTDIYPYVKKYSVPYQGNDIHKDKVYMVLLPIRRERINRIISMLGGTPEAAPVDEKMVELKFWNSIANSTNPADFEAYLAKYPNGRNVGRAKALTTEGRRIHQELADIARQVIEAGRRGDKATLDAWLADDYVGRRDWHTYTKARTLFETKVDMSVRSYEIEKTDLGFKGENALLTATVKYESYDSRTARYANQFTFTRRQGQWKIIAWDWGREPEPFR